MTRTLTVGFFLLPLLLASVSEAFLRAKFTPAPSPFCQTPRQDAGSEAVVPANFKTTCKNYNDAERDKLVEGFEVLKNHVAGLVKETIPVNKEMTAYLSECLKQFHSRQFRVNSTRIDELRNQTTVAAIEGGRITEAVTQYVISRSWENWRSIVDRIYANPRRHRQHIENLIAFIGSLPVRQEQIEFFHYLRNAMVVHKDHESYLGALFASIARRVVVANDGKTVLNQTDERDLYTTMLGASIGYFKRSFLAGQNVIHLVWFDRDFPNLFKMVLSQMFNTTKEDLKKWDGFKMVTVPCKMPRVQSRIAMFRESILLLKRHFLEKSEIHIHLPRLAGSIHICMSELEKDQRSRGQVVELKKMFSTFKKGTTYESLLKVMEKRLAPLSG